MQEYDQLPQILVLGLMFGGCIGFLSYIGLWQKHKHVATSWKVLIAAITLLPSTLGFFVIHGHLLKLDFEDWQKPNLFPPYQSTLVLDSPEIGMGELIFGTLLNGFSPRPTLEIGIGALLRSRVTMGLSLFDFGEGLAKTYDNREHTCAFWNVQSIGNFGGTARINLRVENRCIKSYKLPDFSLFKLTDDTGQMRYPIRYRPIQHPSELAHGEVAQVWLSFEKLDPMPAVIRIRHQAWYDGITVVF